MCKESADYKTAATAQHKTHVCNVCREQIYYNDTSAPSKGGICESSAIPRQTNCAQIYELPDWHNRHPYEGNYSSGWRFSTLFAHIIRHSIITCQPSYPTTLLLLQPGAISQTAEECHPQQARVSIVQHNIAGIARGGSPISYAEAARAVLQGSSNTQLTGPRSYPKDIYYERRVGVNCQIHTLNAFFGDNIFKAEEIMSFLLELHSKDPDNDCLKGACVNMDTQMTLSTYTSSITQKPQESALSQLLP